MTPRRLDPEAIQRRLVEIRRATGRLRELLPVTASELGADWKRRALVERLFEQLVEQAVAINGHVAVSGTGVPPDQYRESFLAAAEVGAIPGELAERLAGAAGMRNVIVHDYIGTDMGLLAAGVTAAPDDFDAYAAAVAEWLTGV